MKFPALAENPLASRSDLQRALDDLIRPVLPFVSASGARVDFDGSGARHGKMDMGLEGFSRLLWGLIPLHAGGGDFAEFSMVPRALVAGTDPAHPEYWGERAWPCQANVEMAAIGMGLALTPELVWEPLTARERANLTRWLLVINRVDLPPNNWQFFRILVNHGLRAVGAEHDPAVMESTFAQIEKMYVGGGWYTDHVGGPGDYYVPFALHYYGLVYARLAEEHDATRAGIFRERAAEFAADFIHWHAADGSMVPYGRSLTYRFSQAAFWSAAAFAGIETFSPAVMKGLVLRHLRWWFRQPIFTETGLLTVGYRYPNLNIAEDYNAPGSPYWALKTFLVLALAEETPFWQAEEAVLPELEPVREIPEAAMIVCHDPGATHTLALCAGTVPVQYRHTPEKYGKFAYSTAFGFCVATEPKHLHARGFDNALALSEDGVYWRVRDPLAAGKIRDGALECAPWQAWPDVTVTSWVIPACAWHVRVHRVVTSRDLETAEGGFAIRNGQAEGDELGFDSETSAHDAMAITSEALSGICELSGERTGEIARADANSNLLSASVVIPALRGRLAPGDHWLVTAVLGTFGPDGRSVWEQPLDFDSAGWLRRLQSRAQDVSEG